MLTKQRLLGLSCIGGALIQTSGTMEPGEKGHELLIRTGAKLSSMSTYVFNKVHQERKRNLFRNASKVVELDPSQGQNFGFYRDWVVWRGAEEEGLALQHVHDNAAENGFPFRSLECDVEPLREYLAKQESGTCESVVATRVLSTRDDYDEVVSEIYRILQPGGSFYFVDYTQNSGFSGGLQHLLNPFFRLATGGCYLTRPVAQALFDHSWQVDMHQWFSDSTTPSRVTCLDGQLSSLSGLRPVVGAICTKPTNKDAVQLNVAPIEMVKKGTIE